MKVRKIFKKYNYKGKENMNEVNYKKLENNDVKESKKKKIVTNLLGLLNKQIIKIVLIILVLFVAIIGIKKSFLLKVKQQN